MPPRDAVYFKPMLAKDPKYKDGQPAIPFPVVFQAKLDGIRAAIVNGKLVSRTLKPIPNEEIRAVLERPEFEGLDGELIVGEPVAEDVYRTTASYVMAPSKTGERWSFIVFDKWNEDGGYATRHAATLEVVEGEKWRGGGDTVAPLVMIGDGKVEIANDAAELAQFEQTAVADGHEGGIARDPDAPYKFGRSTPGSGPLWKIKRFVDFEAEVIGVYEEMHNANEAKKNELGRTQRSTAKAGKSGKGTLGGLVLRALNGLYAGVEFRCGTGFDAAQRASLWAESATLRFDHDHSRRNGLNGRIAVVKSFPIGVKSKPRHPVFKGWRDLEVDG